MSDLSIEQQDFIGKNGKPDSVWADGTGHVIWLIEFEDMTAFGNLWSDPEFVEIRVKIFRRVDNPSYRILSEAISILPE